MQKSVQARKNRIISAMSGQFQSELPIFKTNRNTNRELKVRAIMFRCQKCKKWLKNITTETDVVYDDTIYHATNVPAKICPECGKITIYEIIQERIVQYATQRNVKNIDFTECENEEASASQLIL